MFLNKMHNVPPFIRKAGRCGYGLPEWAPESPWTQGIQSLL